MKKSKQELLKEKYEEFQAQKRSTSSIEYTLIEQDVFRLNTEAMKGNSIVKAQIKASKKIPLEEA
ncbi:hypothetical protein ACN3E9_20005 [Vibrio pectenicida]|uniref:hypothetical protein n=1 Tax=Vibrio pectenicida TaxID=62763 RepID=UPI003B9BFD97